MLSDTRKSQTLLRNKMGDRNKEENESSTCCKLLQQVQPGLPYRGHVKSNRRDAPVRRKKQRERDNLLAQCAVHSRPRLYGGVHATEAVTHSWVSGQQISSVAQSCLPGSQQQQNIHTPCYPSASSE